MKNIYSAVLKAQKEITHAVKDAKNPHFKSKYATLESVIDAVKKPLNDNGILVVHATSSELILTTSLIHAESGESISSSVPLLMSKQDMQQLGSSETYSKRYNLTALLNLPTEDDDGNAAVAAQQKTEVKQEVKITQLASNLDFVINLGPKNKMTNTKASDHSAEWLQKTIDSTLKWHQDNNKQLHANTQEFVDKANAYLKSLPTFNSKESLF
jgi:hypothetical protein